MFVPTQNLQNKNYNELMSLFTSRFNSMSMIYGSYNVFENILDCAINGFSFNYDHNVMESIRKKYKQDERYCIGEMIQIWIFIMNKKVRNNSSFDFWGNFYEENAMSKQSGFAQFFTPEPICKLMASITFSKEGNHNDKNSVHEPTCGSGRLNLAINDIVPNLFHWANDLDVTCAKMSALNLFLHGIKGIVTCDDALLSKDKFRGAFIINDKNVLGIRYCSDVEEAYGYIGSVVGSKTFVYPEHIEAPIVEELKLTQLSLF